MNIGFGVRLTHAKQFTHTQVCIMNHLLKFQDIFPKTISSWKDLQLTQATTDDKR